MLVLELTLLRELTEVVGEGAPVSIAPSVVGEPDSGLEKPKGAVRRFFWSIVGSFAEEGSSIGVNGDNGGWKMLRLFLRRRSDMTTLYWLQPQAKVGCPS